MTIDQALKKAIEAHKARKIQEAEKLYKGVLEVIPNHAQANYNLGVLLLSSNSAVEALTFLKKAVEANGNVEQFWLAYVDTLINQGKFEKAKQILKKAKKKGLPQGKLDSLRLVLSHRTKEKKSKNEKPSQSENNRLLNLYRSNSFDEAEQLAVSLTKSSPSDAFAWKILGAVYRQTGRDSEALSAFQELVRLSPQDPEAEYNLGVTWQGLSNYEEAITCYERAISIKSDYADPYYNLGNLHRNLGNLKDAKSSYIKAIELRPNYAEVHNNLGNILQDMEGLNKAEDSYKKAISIKPDFADPHANLGVVLQEMGRYAEAESHYRRAIELNTGFVQAYNNLGSVLQETDRIEEAEKVYLQTIALKADFADAYYNLGIVLQKQGKLAEGVSSIQKSFALRNGLSSQEEDVLSPATTGLFFELTNKCNFHCLFCPSDSQKRDLGSMDFDLVKRLYDEAAEKKIASVVNLHLMGEPTLHPKLIDVLKYAASKKVKTDLVTNGSTLVGKVVPRIFDALYGTIIASHMTPTENSYQYRGEVGLSWDRYIGNLRFLVREHLKRMARGTETRNNVVIRVLATKNTHANVSVNDSEEEAKSILKEWIDFVSEVERELGLSPFKRRDVESGEILQGNSRSSISYPLQQRLKLTFWRAFTFANTRVGDEFQLEKRTENAYCHHPFTDVGVLWNGDVTLCCLDHDGELKVGNIKDSSIEEVIRSDSAKKLRGSMLGDSPVPTICQTCQSKPVARKHNDRIIASSG